MSKHFFNCPIFLKDLKATLFTVGFLLLIVYPCWTQSTSQKATTVRVLKATTIPVPPFLMESDYNNQSTKEGIIIDLLKEIGKVINVSFVIDIVKDGHYGTQDDRGNWTGMIGEVISGKADVAAAPLIVHSNRVFHVDMSHPFMTYGVKIVIKKPRNVSTRNNILFMLQPFTPIIWLLVLLAFGVTGTVLGIIGRFSPLEWTNTSAVQVDKEKRESFNWGNSFWYILTTFLRQGYQHYPRSYSGRIMSVSWWIFSLLTLVMYFACMIGELQSNFNWTVTLPFYTYDEMSRQTEVQYGTVNSSNIFNYFKNSDQITEQRIYKYMVNSKNNMMLSTSEGLKKVRASNGRYAFIMEGAPAEYAVSRYPCDLMLVGEDIYKHSYSLVTKKDSALMAQLNYAILKLKEQGVIDRIHSKWKSGECFKNSDQKDFLRERRYYNRMEKAPVSNWFGASASRLIAGPLVILLVGILVSASVLAVEIFWARKATKRGSSSSEDGHKLNDNFENEN